MTSQAVTGGVWGKAGGRDFSATSTDGSFTNAMTTVTGSAQLGEAMKNQTIDHICIDYAGGASVWKIVNRVSQQVQRQGFCFVTYQSDPSQANIPAYTVQLDDILQVFTVAVPT